MPLYNIYAMGRVRDATWAPTSAPGCGSATLPGRLLVTTIEPTRQTSNSPAWNREAGLKVKVPKFDPGSHCPKSPTCFNIWGRKE